EPREDMGPGTLQSLRSAGTRGIARADRDAAPPELLRERRPGDEAGVTITDGVCARDHLDLAPVQAGLAEGGAGCDDPVLGEVDAPLAPRVHAGTQDVHGFRTHGILQAWERRTTPSSSV